MGKLDWPHFTERPSKTCAQSTHSLAVTDKREGSAIPKVHVTSRREGLAQSAPVQITTHTQTSPTGITELGSHFIAEDLWRILALDAPA